MKRCAFTFPSDLRADDKNEFIIDLVSNHSVSGVVQDAEDEDKRNSK